jgi:hypothetical protein
MNSEAAVRENTVPYLVLSFAGIALMFAIGIALLRFFRVSNEDVLVVTETAWPDVALAAIRLLAVYFIATGFVDGFRIFAQMTFMDSGRSFFVSQLIQGVVSFVGGLVLLLVAKPLAGFVVKI